MLGLFLTVGIQASVLRQAEDARLQAEKGELMEDARSVLALLECLVFDSGRPETGDKQISPTRLEQLFNTFASIITGTRPVHKQFRSATEQFLERVAGRWASDVLPLARALRIFESSRPPVGAGGQAFETPARRLWALVVPKLIDQIASNFHQPGFVRRLVPGDETTREFANMLLNAESPLWKDGRGKMIGMLNDAPASAAIRENAYEMLYWLDYLVEKQGASDGAARKLLSEREVFQALWAAATAAPLSASAVGRLQGLAKRQEEQHIKISYPPWWKDRVNELNAAWQASAVPATGPAPTQPPAET